MMMIRTIYWENDTVVMIDQKALPLVERTVTCREYGQVIAAINDLTIRGAPAIGVAAAMGIALGVLRAPANAPDAFQESFDRICHAFSQTRPTARNLFWAIERMRKCLENALAAPTPKPPRRPPRVRTTKETQQISLFGPPPQDAQSLEIPEEPWGLEIRKALVEEAVRIGEEDIAINRRIGAAGKYLIENGDRILTHCNAGALATAGYGTALGVIRAAWAEGKRIHLYIDETRPVLQGARLTAWEMMKEGIPATLITDNMAGFLMKQKRIDKIIVGADRIARNGDTANKIGTYSLAVLAKAHGIPLYVAAPLSTIDASIADGTEIPIEERGPDEVTQAGGLCMAPAGIAVYNPAFDVTPHELITAIITEAGRVVPPFGKRIAGLFGQ
jgi:methylthioribose-1-phosphate isomerase